MAAMVDFMYHGEVNIYQDDLDGFLKIADELELKGLIGSYEEPMQPNVKTELQPKPKCTPTMKLNKYEYHHGDARSLVGSNIEHKGLLPPADLDPLSLLVNSQLVKPANLNEKLTVVMDQSTVDRISNMMEKRDGVWTCSVCAYITKLNRKAHLMEHVENQHISGLQYPCTLCGATLRSSSGLRNHYINTHKSRVTSLVL
jgi:hypothetical protein